MAPATVTSKKAAKDWAYILGQIDLGSLFDHEFGRGQDAAVMMMGQSRGLLPADSGCHRRLP